MAEYIPQKHYMPHTIELILERIKSIENCTSKPFDTGELIALQKAVLVLNAYDKGNLVERKTGKWEYDHHVWVCSCCGKNPTRGMGYVQAKEELFPYCPNCGAEME